MEMGRRLSFYHSHFRTFVVVFGKFQHLSMSFVAGRGANCLHDWAALLLMRASIVS